MLLVAILPRPLAGEVAMRSVAGEGSVNKFNAEVVALPSPGAARRPLPLCGRGKKSSLPVICDFPGMAHASPTGAADPALSPTEQSLDVVL